MDFERINEVVAGVLANKKSYDFAEVGNKYYHGQRVAKLSLTLRRILLPCDETHDGILTVAGWFHDIANGEKNHSERGAEMTRELLAGLCTPDELERICGIIAVHDDRYNGRDYPPLTKILQDADMLDHMGAYDVFINCAYTIIKDHTLCERIKYMTDAIPSEREKMKRGLNFEISRRIFDDKVACVTNFADRFALEYGGEVYGLDAILENYKGEQ